LRHPASGTNAEIYFRAILSEYLPKRFSIDSGFVVSADGTVGDFIDVLIVDSFNLAPLPAC